MTAKAKRIFHRLATGLQIARNQESDMRFLTLTTALTRVKGRTGKIRTLKDSFDVLRDRIKRATVKKSGFQGFKMNRYYCLRTSEGLGVLHIVFWGGRFIPIDWLSRAWEQIHGAHEVDIEYIHKKRKNVSSLVGYLLDRYLLRQPIKRMSYGWLWAWLGFCKSWQNVKAVYGMLKKPSIDTKPKVHKYQSMRSWFRNASVEAWKKTLWEHPIGTRKTRLKDSTYGADYEKPDPGPKSVISKPLPQHVAWTLQTEVLWFGT